MMLLVIFIVYGDNGLKELFRKRGEYHRLSSANQQLIEENFQLFRMVDRLHNDPAYIEDIARKELGMVRADELIFTFASELETPRP